MVQLIERSVPGDSWQAALPAARLDKSRDLQQHPELAATLCRDIAVHRSDRVRRLTGDLTGWVSRSDAVRPAPPDSPTIPP